MREMEANPTTRELLSDVNSGTTIDLAIGELVDNCLDAGATEIVVETGKTFYRITDNGRGTDTPWDIVQKGVSRSQFDAQKSGMYGIGAPKSLTRLGRYHEIHSVTETCYRMAVRDIDEQLRTERFVIHTDELAMADEDGLAFEVGTTVHVDRLNSKRRPNKGRLIESLTRQFRPAIKAGVKIDVVWDGECHGLVDAGHPRFSKKHPTVSGVYEVEGRKFEVIAGVMEDRQPELTGCHIVKLNRRVREDRALVAKGGPDFYAWVDLKEPSEVSEWELTQFKDDIADDELKRSLEDVLVDLFQPILRSVGTTGQRMKIRNINLALNQIVEDRLERDADGTLDAAEDGEEISMATKGDGTVETPGGGSDGPEASKTRVKSGAELKRKPRKVNQTFIDFQPLPQGKIGRAHV